MQNGYKKSDCVLFTRKAVLKMRKMEAELKELRYYMERNVEQRTGNLLKRIAMLESCNATLCDKLASAHQMSAVRNQPSTQILFKNDTESNDSTVKLYVINNQTRKAVGSVIQNQCDEHATAA